MIRRGRPPRHSPGASPWLQRRRAPRPRQAGIALMLVLWIVALLTIIALGMTTVQRTESALAANQLGSARFRALAEAAIHYCALNLLAQPSLEAAEEGVGDAHAPWLPDGSPRNWRFAGETLEITVTNEASLIDLNQAPRELLGGLLSAVGVPLEDQDPLLDAILDWRDSDDLHLLNGAEDPDYDAAGRPYGAKDGPFDSVEELLQVLGFDPPLYRALAPALTVDSGRARVVQDLAPPLVRAALDGLTLDEVQQRLLEEEAAQPPVNGVRPLNRGGPLYRVRVTLRTADGSGRSMEALFLAQGTGGRPVAVLWRRFAPGLERPATAGADGGYGPGEGALLFPREGSS